MKSFLPLSIFMKIFACLTLMALALSSSGCKPSPYYEQIDVDRVKIQTYVEAAYAPFKLTDYKQLNIHSDPASKVKVFNLARLSDGKTVKELTLVVYDEAGKTQIREATADEIKNEMTAK